MHGKRSEKLNDDERQLAFEDLETALAEAETRQDAGTAPRTPRAGPPAAIAGIFRKACPA